MPMIGVSEEELNRDRERLLNFIKETPHPDYDFVSNQLILRTKAQGVWWNQPRPYERDLRKHVWQKHCEKKRWKDIHTRRDESTTKQLQFTNDSVGSFGSATGQSRQRHHNPSLLQHQNDCFWTLEWNRRVATLNQKMNKTPKLLKEKYLYIVRENE